MPNTILWWALTIIPWHLHNYEYFLLAYILEPSASSPLLQFMYSPWLPLVMTWSDTHWLCLPEDITQVTKCLLGTETLARTCCIHLLLKCAWNEMVTQQLKSLCHKIGHYTYSKHLELCPQVKTFITHICTICIVFNLHKCTARQPLPFDITNQVSFKCPT